MLDGSKAIEIQSVFRGVVINTRHLTDAEGKEHGRTVQGFMAAGAVAVAVALVTFFFTIINAGREKERFDKYLNDGGESKNFQWARQSPVLDVTVFGGIASAFRWSTWGSSVARRRRRTTSSARTPRPIRRSLRNSSEPARSRWYRRRVGLHGQHHAEHVWRGSP
jgi:hypothetical protein